MVPLGALVARRGEGEGRALGSRPRARYGVVTDPQGRCFLRSGLGPAAVGTVTSTAAFRALVVPRGFYTRAGFLEEVLLSETNLGQSAYT